MRTAPFHRISLLCSIAGLAGLLAAAGCSPAGAARSMTALSADGARIGALSELDGFPLYELRYEAPYRVEDFFEALPERGASAAFASPAPARENFACTCFSATDRAGRRVMGRNFDWDRHPVLLLRARPPGAYASLSLVDLHYLGYSEERSPFDDPGSLAAAPRLPFDGINEKGLAVGMMAVDHAEGIARGVASEAPPRRLVGELVLIRILLDRAASVKEAIALAKSFDVDFEEIPIHYFVADASGASAVIEYLGGEAVALANDAAWQLSTNFILAEVPPERREASCWRYSKASRSLAASGGKLGPKGAFGLLEAVSQPKTTWSSAYELGSPSLELALGRDYARHFRFELSGRKR
jgi:hypothetical protein